MAQIGQGIIADPSAERLGHGDVGVVAIRKLWHRESNGVRLRQHADHLVARSQSRSARASALLPHAVR